MGDLLIYIFSGVGLSVSIGYFVYTQAKFKNYVIIKSTYGSFYIVLVSLLLGTLLFVTYDRKTFGTVLDLILTLVVYLICFALVFSIFYIASIRIGFEGNVLFKNTIINKRRINVKNMECATEGKYTYEFKDASSKITFEKSLFKNEGLIISNIDIKKD